jgi:hypothetical protein
MARHPYTYIHEVLFVILWHFYSQQYILPITVAALSEAQKGFASPSTEIVGSNPT